MLCAHEVVTKTCFRTDSGEGCFGGENCHRSDIDLDLRSGFQPLAAEVPRQEQLKRRRNIRIGPGRKPFLGGSDPTLCGFQPPIAVGAGGRYRPSCPAEFLTRSPAEL